MRFRALLVLFACAFATDAVAVDVPAADAGPAHVAWEQEVGR